jgi:hypothetical protein
LRVPGAAAAERSIVVHLIGCGNNAGSAISGHTKCLGVRAAGGSIFLRRHSTIGGLRTRTAPVRIRPPAIVPIRAIT